MVASRSLIVHSPGSGHLWDESDMNAPGDGDAMARSIGIWTSGLLASAMFGAMSAQHITGYDGWLGGLVIGIAVFTCARLWLTERRMSP